MKCFKWWIYALFTFDINARQIDEYEKLLADNTNLVDKLIADLRVAYDHVNRLESALIDKVKGESE